MPSQLRGSPRAGYGKKAVNTLGIKADGKYKLTVTLDRRIPYFKLLYYTNEATLVKTSVKGVVFNGAGALYNFKEAYIK